MDTWPRPHGRESQRLTPPIPSGREPSGVTPSMPSSREPWGVTPSMPSSREPWGLTPPMPSDRESRRLTPPMPSSRESHRLTPPMPGDRELWGLTQPMSRSREPQGLTPPMVSGRESWGLTSPVPSGRESHQLTPLAPSGRESHRLTPQLFQPSRARSPLSTMALGQGSKMGAAGLYLSCLATVLLAVCAATESWLRLWVLGIVIHRGLWQECQLGTCTPLQGQRAYVGVSRGCLVPAVLTSYLSVLCGALALTPCPAPKGLDWARGAAALCFLTGALATLALGSFMVGSAREAGGSWAWSLVVGWMAVPAACLAGTCHRQALRRERRLHSGQRGPPSFSDAPAPRLAPKQSY
ncbi:uncharacterized protein LOC112544991 [Pelodiscus sinensis]|uniref:uncharacterized protein LOC112544991 n=1 Tax=Pelodiscus sinensis TaxID=13735 RepID=UPI003F6CCF35